MVDYWLDSGVFIEPAKGAYALDIAPGYWALIEHLARYDRASSPMMVYHELQETRDELLAWVEERKETIFVNADEAVYECFTEVADHVSATYQVPHVGRFLDVADPWLIAHAKAQGGAVVTLETRAGPKYPVAKIPNVCEALDVPWMTPYDMLRKEGVSFEWSPPKRRSAR